MSAPCIRCLGFGKTISHFDCWRCGGSGIEQTHKPDVRWARIIAIGLGVLLALWLLRGDARPEAAESFTLKVTPIEVSGGIAFYRLTGSDGGAGVLAVDTDVTLARILSTHKKLVVQ